MNDFASYAKSLPVRSCRRGEFLQLYKLRYFFRSKDLISMSNKIINHRDMGRPEVTYISAPSASGKTSSVLPAFLVSQHLENNGTHYFYLAFSNNNERSFKSRPSTPNSDRGIAEEQGAAFIFECVKTLLERPDNLDDYCIKVPKSPKRRMGTVIREMNGYLADKLGDGCRVWFHVDEHAKMCDLSPESKGNGAGFSFGAMSTLARLKGAKVIATYVDRPSSIPGVGSSDVCRYPVALPPVDINQVMSNVKELYIDQSEFTKGDEQRMMSSLKVRLSFMLRGLLKIPVLHQRGALPEAEKFLRDFAKAKNSSNPLVACNKLCKFKLSTEDLKGENIDDDAANLLLGYLDADNLKKQIFDVISLPEGKITVSIGRLIRATDKNHGIYNIGKELFKNTLKKPDILSETPLEAAYYWTLSCMSACEGEVELGSLDFPIRCKSLKPGRLFPNTDSSVYNLEFLEPDTFYYADEKNANCKCTHPLADLFFVSKDQLVLVDITGGNKRNVKQKQINLMNWIMKERQYFPIYIARNCIGPKC